MTNTCFFLRRISQIFKGLRKRSLAHRGITRNGSRPAKVASQPLRISNTQAGSPKRIISGTSLTASAAKSNGTRKISGPKTPPKQTNSSAANIAKVGVYKDHGLHG